MREMSKAKHLCTMQLFTVSYFQLIYSAREPMLMMLVKQGALIDAKDINGMTPLHHAAIKSDP
jgi:hypothetical protein